MDTLKTDVDTLPVSVSLADDASGVEVTGASEASDDIKSLRFNTINVDRGRNPREEEAYSSEKLDWLSRNIVTHGLLEPLVVSKRADGTVWLLKGHLRHAAIERVRVEGIKGTKKEPEIPVRPDFMDRVRCRVLTGLTPVQELDLLMDHGTSTPLNKRERFKAIKDLRIAGFSQQAIAKKFKIDRTPVRIICYILEMPQFVEAEYLRKGTKDDPTMNFTDDVVNALYKAWNADKSAGHVKYREDEPGPSFRQEWESFVAEGKKPRAKTISKSDLESRANLLENADIRDLLRAIAEGDTVKMNQAISRIEIAVSLATDDGQTIEATVSEA